MRSLKYIIIHHSLTSKDISLNKSIESFNKNHKERLHPGPNWYWLHIAYHYVIWGKGEVKKTRPLKEIWYHAWNRNINKKSIWICLCGNFDIEEPNEKQYETCFKLIKEIQTKFPNIKIMWHNEVVSWKSCPGFKFNMNKLIRQRLEWKLYDTLELICKWFWDRVEHNEIRKRLNEIAQYIRWERN